MGWDATALAHLRATIETMRSMKDLRVEQRMALQKLQEAEGLLLKTACPGCGRFDIGSEPWFDCPYCRRIFCAPCFDAHEEQEEASAKKAEEAAFNG